MTDAEQITLEVSGLALAAKVWGPPDGPRVLASHGWLDNANTWDRLAPLLPGLRIVAIDLPGHGLSEHRPVGCSYHFLDLPADLFRVADALEWEDFCLLGHSMGAAASALAAGTFPDRIQRLVLVEGLGPLVEDPEKAAYRMAMAITQENARAAKHKRTFADLELAISRIAEVTKMEVSSARILIERGMVPVDGGHTWRADPRLRLPSRVRFSEAQVLAFLQRISCPTLLIEASDGWEHDVKSVQARMDCIESLEHVRLEGHHHLHLDRPQTVGDAVRPFLQPLLEKHE